MEPRRRVKYAFKGLMAPVFTCFDNTPQCHVVYDGINAYAKYLKQLDVHAVLVNGSTGEGPSLSMVERECLVANWRTATDCYDQSMMVQIGGAPIIDVMRMAAHAESQGANAVLLLPDLFYSPNNEMSLVEYCARVAVHCPKTPMLYYHNPVMTGVNLHMPKFLEAAENEIPNFCGIKYTSGNLEEGSMCLSPGRSVFLGCDTVLCGALALGFDSACMTSLNIWPRLAELQMRAMKPSADGVCSYLEAKSAQDRLNSNIAHAMKTGEFVFDMKTSMCDNLRLIGAPFTVGRAMRMPRTL